MSAYAAPIEVVQAALHRCGEENIVSLDEGSPAALVANSNYEGIVRAALARHAWTFATETANLTLQGPITAGDYVWSWIYGPEVINVRWVMVNGQRLRSREYIIQGKNILTLDAFSTSTPQLVATVRAAEGMWPDDFAEAIVVRLQALFLESLADKWQDARLKEKDAEAKFQAAIVRDKRQQPATSAEFNKLGEAWRIPGRRSHYLG
jgi:hypothetical protein